MRRVYQVASVVCILLGAYVVWQSSGMSVYTEMGPGGGFFPFWLGIVFIGLSTIWLGQVSLQPQPAMEPGFIPDRPATLRILSVVGAMAVFVLIANLIGFRLSMFGFLMFLFIALGRQNLLVTIAISLAGSFGVYYVFSEWLQVSLPVTSLPFLVDLGL